MIGRFLIIGLTKPKLNNQPTLVLTIVGQLLIFFIITGRFKKIWVSIRLSISIVKIECLIILSIFF
jgi:hypothetical protein